MHLLAKEVVINPSFCSTGIEMMKKVSARTYLNLLQSKNVGVSAITLPAIKNSYPRASQCPSEASEQKTVAGWLRLMNIPHHHSPNGGFRNALEGVKFKKLGTSAGFPDLFIPKARKGFHGILIEMKKKEGGKLTETQKNWRDLLISEGYAWYEAKGADECIAIINDYLG